jgi:hypothetical protein
MEADNDVLTFFHARSHVRAPKPPAFGTGPGFGLMPSGRDERA